MPSAVTNRVVSPARSALCTRLAATVMARSNPSGSSVAVGRRVEHDGAPAQPLRRVLLHQELFAPGRRLPVDRTGLVAVDVLTQTVEFTGPEAPSHRQQMRTEDALTELWHVEQVRPRCHEHLVDIEQQRSCPGDAERIAMLDDQRAEPHDAAAVVVSSYPVVVKARPAIGGTGSRAVYGAARGRPTVSDRSKETDGSARQVLDPDVDAAHVAGDHHHGMDPPPAAEPRPPDDDDGHRHEHRGEEADADDEQLEDAEDPGDHDRRDAGADGDPALPRDRSHCAIGTGTASNTSPIASLGDEVGTAVGPQHDAVAERRPARPP